MIKIEKIIHGTPLITIWFADKEISDKGIVVYNESKNAFPGSTEFVTLVSDLTLSKEELLAKCAQNCRYKVRRAYRENVEVIMKDSKQITDEDISTFLEFFEIFWKSKDVNFDSKDSLHDETDCMNLNRGLSAGCSVQVPLSKKEDGIKLAVDYSFRQTYSFNGTHSVGARILF